MRKYGSRFFIFLDYDGVPGNNNNAENFTRAFRLNKELKDSNDLLRCDRQLFEKLKALDANALTEKTKRYLNKDEVKAVMARRTRL